MTQLTADQVEWVTNDIAELGVKIGNQFFFLYKGKSLNYEGAGHDDGSPMHWRPVFTREFGECAHPINYKDPTRIGTVSLDDSDDWKPLPDAVSNTRSPVGGHSRYHLCGPTVTLQTADGEKTFGTGWMLISEAEYAALSPAPVPLGDVGGLVEALRSPDHRQPIDPKAVYRTRDVKLFEDAANALSALSLRQADKSEGAAADDGQPTIGDAS